jgi:hypothetical protein
MGYYKYDDDVYCYFIIEHDGRRSGISNARLDVEYGYNTTEGYRPKHNP